MGELQTPRQLEAGSYKNSQKRNNTLLLLNALTSNGAEGRTWIARKKERNKILFLLDTPASNVPATYVAKRQTNRCFY
jgi:hypothetical protein